MCPIKKGGGNDRTRDIKRVSGLTDPGGEIKESGDLQGSPGALDGAPWQLQGRAQKGRPGQDLDKPKKLEKSTWHVLIAAQARRKGRRKARNEKKTRTSLQRGGENRETKRGLQEITSQRFQWHSATKRKNRTHSPGPSRTSKDHNCKSLPERPRRAAEKE